MKGKGKLKKREGREVQWWGDEKVNSITNRRTDTNNYRVTLLQENVMINKIGFGTQTNVIGDKHTSGQTY